MTCHVCKTQSLTLNFIHVVRSFETCYTYTSPSRGASAHRFARNSLLQN